jgi:hypothetical protein
VDPVPTASRCALDEGGRRSQLKRYQIVGAHARSVERDRRHLVVDLAGDVNVQLVDELIAIERECCPFFTIGWQSERRRLTVSVSRAEHEPALDAIAFALEVETPAQP